MGGLQVAGIALADVKIADDLASERQTAKG